MEWLPSSPHFDGIILIAPEGLNDITITSQHKEILMKQIKKNVFDPESPKTHCVKRKDTTPPSGNIPKETIR